MLPVQSPPRLGRDEFRRFCRLVHQHAGIHIKEGKEALVCARVNRRMRVLGLTRFRDYLRLLEQTTTDSEIVEFVDVMSTNYTTFFRERAHYDALAAAVGEGRAAGRRRFRIWSAACATGEEPYSIAMTMARVCDDPSLDWRILATDISTRALGHARRGRYRARAMQTVSRHERLRYFVPDRQSDPPCWSVRPEIVARVAFARLNLSTPPFPMRGPFDAIFCRNVMIYLDHEVRRALVAAIEGLLRPGGLLMVGHAESLAGLTGLTLVQPSTYRR
jgi:chemotaxis protein methyltransferase CheR